MEVLWPMDRAVDDGEGQPGPELGPGGSCGVHSWIEGASGDGRRGFLGLCHKTKEADGGRRRQVMEARASISGLMEATGVDGV